MLKQKKNINLKFLYKTCKRYRVVFETNKSILNKMLFLTIPSKLQKIVFKITSNNIFCSLIQNKRTLLTTSAGKEKVNVSKKTLKFNSKVILVSFFKKIRKKIKSTTLFVNIVASLKIKQLILRLLKKHVKFKRPSLLINIEHKKCFNGCRPKKKKRKKQKGLRIFK